MIPINWVPLALAIIPGVSNSASCLYTINNNVMLHWWHVKLQFYWIIGSISVLDTVCTNPFNNWPLLYDKVMFSFSDCRKDFRTKTQWLMSTFCFCSTVMERWVMWWKVDRRGIILRGRIDDSSSLVLMSERESAGSKGAGLHRQKRWVSPQTNDCFRGFMSDFFWVFLLQWC